MLHRSPSTISRELRRLGTSRAYSPSVAHILSNKAASKRRNIQKFRHEGRSRIITERLKRGHSPQQISGWLKRKRSKHYLCTEAIYRWIYSLEGLSYGWRNLLLRCHKKRKRRAERKHRKPHIQHMVSITERPQAVHERQEFGHYECDLVVFGTETAPNVGVLLERKSRLCKLSLNTSKKAKEVMGNVKQKLQYFNLKKIQSVTFDQGLEFAHHYELRQKPFGIKTYFCAAHSPWQKGSIENFNGILRRFLPKSFDSKTITLEMLQDIEDKINTMPRKILGFKSAKEVYQQTCKRDIQAMQMRKRDANLREMKSAKANLCLH